MNEAVTPDKSDKPKTTADYSSDHQTAEIASPCSASIVEDPKQNFAPSCVPSLAPSPTFEDVNNVVALRECNKMRINFLLN